MQSVAIMGEKLLTNNDELYTILMEECAEVTVEASKIIRFGNNTERLEREIGDLLCMIELMKSRGLIDTSHLKTYSNLKMEKLKQFSNLFSNNA